MHVFSRMVMGDLEMPRRTKAFHRAKEMMPAVRATPKDHPILRLAYRLVRERMEPRNIPTMTALQVSCFILSPEPR